jgi:hypothetical protein
MALLSKVIGDLFFSRRGQGGDGSGEDRQSVFEDRRAAEE